MTSLFTDSQRLARVGLVMLAGLWWVSAQGALAAAVPPSFCANQNGICEAGQGENCESCPEDCDCSCGDDLCTGTSPALETCSSCPEDCWDQCVCGDSVCVTPAEYGGYGSFNEPECNPEDPAAECSYCAADCGQCSAAACDPYVCEDEYGQCRECQDHGECFHSNQYCTWYGQCELAGTECDGQEDCDPGWYCDIGTWPAYCKPQNAP